jgi:hypothetical protein
MEFGHNNCALASQLVNGPLIQWAENRATLALFLGKPPMDACEDGGIESESKPGPGAAARDEPPALTAGGDAEHDNAPKVEARRLHLIPYAAPPRAETASEAKTGRRWPLAWPIGLAASLVALAAVAAAGLYDHFNQSHLLVAKAEESRSLARTITALKDRMDVIEAARARDETADSRKITAELKAESSATHDLSGALSQLATRVERVDHDQNARIDKLADRIDHDSAARIADLAARLDKLEKKAAAPVVAAVPTPPPPAPPKPATVVAKADPAVSNETTGSIEKPKPPLRNYLLVDVQDGFAVVAGRDGPRQVAPGDFLPGAGRVQRIERRGRDWVVVTSEGVIVSDHAPF